MTTREPKISLVIPVYNEEENLRQLFTEIDVALSGLEKGSWEIVFIDDGSSDTSLDVLKELSAGSPAVKYLAFEQNTGQSAAFKAGFDAARGEIIITMDSDLQNDPADIPRMLAEYDKGFDMICGWRAKRRDTFIKRISSKVGNAVRTWMTGPTVHDTGCSLKIMRASMAKRLPMVTGMHRFLPTLMKLEGARISEVEVNHRHRQYGVSKYGTLDRAMQGGYDLFGVRWIRTRHFRYSVKERN